MRGALFLVAATFLVLTLVIPGPIRLAEDARAWHVGAVECFPGGNPVSDGIITPGEYTENFFDGRTKLLLYLSCDNSTHRFLKVGIVSPWPGWVGLLIQASDPFDDSLNEARVSYVSSLGVVQVMDGYRNASAQVTIQDSLLGGSSDVMNATTGTMDEARIYEFSMPLNSSDRYDSQLQAAGPFYLALEYNRGKSDLTSEPTEISEAHSMVIENAKAPGRWSHVEFVLSSSVVKEKPTMLVSLRDDKDYPVPSTQLEVFVYTRFGFLDAGPIVTNEQGVGEVSYQPLGSGSFFIGVAYTGGYGLLASVSWQVLEVGTESQGSGLELGFFQIGSIKLRTIESIIVITLTSVWATYAYAFFIARRALREDRTHSSGGGMEIARWGPEE